MADTERRSVPAPAAEPPPDPVFSAAVLAMIGRLAGKPDKLRAVLNGLALDGSLARVGLPSGLAPMMRLPGPEPERRIRARMADLILRRVSADGNVTRDDLTAGGFTDAEITRHFHAAKRIAGVADLAA